MEKTQNFHSKEKYQTNPKNIYGLSKKSNEELVNSIIDITA